MKACFHVLFLFLLCFWPIKVDGLVLFCFFVMLQPPTAVVCLASLTVFMGAKYLLKEKLNCILRYWFTMCTCFKWWISGTKHFYSTFTPLVYTDWQGQKVGEYYFNFWIKVLILLFTLTIYKAIVIFKINRIFFPR